MNTDNAETELKQGEYLLTPFQALLINRALSSSIKLESEDNFIKSSEIIRQPIKKQKVNVKYFFYIFSIKSIFQETQMNIKKSVKDKRTWNTPM